jgi:gas vesicle protein GvpA/GvpJ/GvpM family
MPRRALSRRRPVAEDVLDPPQETVLDVLDHLLNKGVMATGEVTLGVAGIDLIYLRLSALLCAADRIMPRAAARRRRKRT